MKNTFGLSGRARCIENKQWIFGVHELRLTFAIRRLCGFVVADITVLKPGDIGIGAAYYKYGVYIWALFQGLVYIRLQGNHASTAYALVGSDNRLAVRVQYSVFDRFGGEAAKHYRVNGPDAGAGKHRIGCLWHHGHIDADTIALANASAF